MTLFDRCISVVLRNEGNFQCDPNDRGNYANGILRGTKYGISARQYPKLDIKNLTPGQAASIYYKDYWTLMNLEGIKDESLVLHIFDHGVNAGKRTAIRMIQRIVGAKMDGIMGLLTKDSINHFKPFSKVIDGYGLLYSLLDHYKYARYVYYTNIIKNRPTMKKYIKGWLSRIDHIHF
jgi:lysozyme family protein